ncbi:uncharacterized protein LOC128552890 [Mercenaria mercenaria]|uniref:uncharacterized protein LOC128552890 n=1 Tax=Mercenaria mercenaria TaxID=6596 RepID=UPI00234F1AD5|nr:uncharacterized protein LOC128552890 [Mercenaria mercenaria]XP_053389935.1 uncharacterized protein LOC128552890 [Mercenaria mercenaria]
MEKNSSASDLCIQSEGFQNWMKCVCAQDETRKALCEVVEVKWKGYLSQMTEEERDHIETFLGCLTYAKIDNLKTRQNQAVLECGHSLCGSLLQKLLQLCNNNLRPKDEETCGIPSSHSCYQHYWDIAKLYIAEDDSVTKTGLKGLDISMLSRMMRSCQLFAFDGSEELYNIICEDRDELFHSSNNNIADEKRSIMLKVMSNLLSNFCGSRLKLCEDVIGDIKQIDAKDWLSEYQYEYKQISRQTLEYKLDAIKLDMSFRQDETLQELLDSSENLLKEVKDSISADESKEERELQKEKEEIIYERNDFMEDGHKWLEESVAQLEKEHCQARLLLVAHCSFFHYGIDISSLQSTSSKIKVTCLGSFQDVFVQIDGKSILFDPFETNLLETHEYFPREHHDHGNIKFRNALQQRKFGLDAVALSTCLNTFTATTVKKITSNPSNKDKDVKWLTPTGRKDWLISIGVKETNIIEFAVWEQKTISLGCTDITFACTKANINSTSLYRKKCNSCGWVIKGSERAFYSSGITNYHEEDFKAVAEKYGQIHLALLPIDEWNMSCLAEFKITLNEVIKMHVNVGSKKSLGICTTRNYLDQDKSDLKQEMEKLQLEPSTLLYLKPGKVYESE